MKILLIDTCGEVGSVALADAGADASTVVPSELPGRSASERLVATVRELAGEGGLAALGAIAVVNGPGSFTGVRVGVSAAKGLAEALAVPVLAISRLAVMAEVAGGGRVLAVLDAGRGEFYCGFYDGQRCEREVLSCRAEVVASASGRRVVLCELKAAEALAELRPIRLEAPRAADALPIALRRIAAGEFDDVTTLDANYLRRTDAEIFAKQKSAGREK
jgi:tRNA threonylcarbamoyladenosine biosynthesis protein TsaB